MNTKNITDLVTENIRQFDAETPQHAVIKSGFVDFDAQFGGFFAGEFVVVGGRPAMGKTQFLINLSLHISMSVPVLYVTLELSEYKLTSRFISSVTQIPTTDILRRELSEEQKAKFFKVGNAFKKRKLFIHECFYNNIEPLLAHCREQIQENGVQVIFIDYLQLLNSQKQRDSNRDIEMSHICREIKNMCKENNVCVIASSQLNRSVEHRGFHKRPQLYDLRESGSIEQDADKVLFIYRPEYYGIVEDVEGNSLKRHTEIIVAKNRSGRMDEFYITRDEDFTNFLNSPKHTMSSGYDFDYTDEEPKLSEFEEKIPF